MLDTAGYGDLAAWLWPPLRAAVEDGGMHGRCRADVQAVAALPSHLRQALAARQQTQSSRRRLSKRRSSPLIGSVKASPRASSCSGCV